MRRVFKFLAVSNNLTHMQSPHAMHRVFKFLAIPNNLTHMQFP
jgi:hypothetical protein